MEANEPRFCVTAYEFSKGYRVRITNPLTRERAEQAAARLTFDMETSIPKYRFFTDIRIEETAGQPA